MVMFGSKKVGEQSKASLDSDHRVYSITDFSPKHLITFGLRISKKGDSFPLETH